MAAGRLPAPGTEFGPCDERASCGHADCAQTVAEAASPCRFCKEPIGYESPCYQEREEDNPGKVGWPDQPMLNVVGNPYVLVHAVCLEKSYGL